MIDNDFETDQEQIGIYSFFIERTKLAEIDRLELQKDRGFSDLIITHLKFRSACKENIEVIEEMRSKFSEQALLKARIVSKDDKGVIKPSYQLICNPLKPEKNNIIIPFMNENGEVYFLRPHKMGLEGLPIQLYIPYRNIDNILIITESEFKAAASIQFGHPAIGVPGIHSFAANNFPRLLDFLKAQLNLKKVIIIFDNEIKDDPKFKNYKQDVLKQWDTQYRAAQLSKMIYEDSDHTIKASIGVLPPEWMVEGKIDIDGALAQGRTKAEFQLVIENCKLPETFISELPSTAQKIIRRKLFRQFYKPSIKRKNNCYYIEKFEKPKKDMDPISRDIRISNFTMKIEKTLVEGGSYNRQVFFTTQDGSVSKGYICKPDTSRLSDFKRWIAGCGNLVFTGEQKDLDSLFELEFIECDGREIKRPQEIGLLKHEESQIWLFGNCLIKEEKLLLPDEDGVIWDGLSGYQPKSIVEKLDGEEGASNKMPVINLKEDTFGLGELSDSIDKMHQNFDNNGIYLAAGWAAACLMSDELFKKFGMFPILFISGKRESGKTTFGNWIMALLGFSEIAGDPLGSTSRAGVARNLSWYSSLAYWLDEYRNDKKGKQFDGYFRNVYQRQATSKGTLGSSIRSEEVNAGVMLSGEETPDDNALLSRCLVISLTRTERKPAVFRELESIRSKGLFSRFILEVLKRRNKIIPSIIEEISGFKERLMKEGVKERIALNYAIPTVCYYKLFLDKDKDILKCQEFLRWVIKDSLRTEVAKEEDHMQSIFFEDLVTLQEDLENFYTVFECPNEKKGKRRIALHFPSFYSKWTEAYRRKGHEAFKQSDMLGYIMHESYFITNASKRIGPNKKVTRCVVLSLDAVDNPPPGLVTLADGSIVSADVDLGGVMIISKEAPPF